MGFYPLEQPQIVFSIDLYGFHLLHVCMAQFKDFFSRAVGVRYLFYVLLAEGPRIMWESLLQWKNWHLNLLLGGLPEREGVCKVRDCDHHSVTSVNNRKSWSEGTPVCRRHYLLVKTGFYSIVITFWAGVVALVYYGLIQ